MSSGKPGETLLIRCNATLTYAFPRSIARDKNNRSVCSRAHMSVTQHQ